MYFQYGEKEISYLKSKDKALALLMDKIGHIDRNVNPDLFFSVVHNIIGQQISTAAHITISNRMEQKLGKICPDTILDCGVPELQKCGISFRKAEYITDFALKVKNGEFDIDSLFQMCDEEIILQLSALKGIGEWTAQMLLIFCLQRPDVLSFGDLAIHRGLRMLYHHRKIDKKLFEKYKRRYSPYASVASLYLWAIAGGAVADMKDYAPQKK